MFTAVQHTLALVNDLQAEAHTNGAAVCGAVCACIRR